MAIGCKPATAIIFATLLLIVPAFVLSGEYPDYGPMLDLPTDSWAADPHVLLVGGTYYLYPTTNEESIECFSSPDLVNWSYEGRVWEPVDPDGWNGQKVWAPDVLHHQGKFYLYYTANTAIGVAVSDSPTGPFEDVYDHPFIGKGYGETALNSIDAHVFEDDDGRLYMYCTFYLPFCGLKVSPMDDPVTVTGEWDYLLFPDITSWELFINEGPWMIKHQGMYYLMYSGNGADMPLYALGYAVSDSPLGPFKKFHGNPILRTDWQREFYGPGHNSVAPGPDGEMLMFYHTKTDGAKNWERAIRFNEIDFNESGELYVNLGDEGDEEDDEPYTPEPLGKAQSDNEYESAGCIG